jgi:hypothetical protein
MRGPSLVTASVWMLAAMVFLFTAWGVLVLVIRKGGDSGTRVAEDSRVVYGSEVFFIQSMEWDSDRLDVVFVHQIPPGQQGLGYVERPWILLYCRTWDAVDGSLLGEVDVTHNFDPSFSRGECDKDTATLTVLPAPGAEYLTIQYGASGVETRKVPIPGKPSLLKRWLRRFK